MSEFLWMLYFFVAVVFALGAYKGWVQANLEGDVPGRRWMVVFLLMSPVWPLTLLLLFVVGVIESR